MKSLFEGGKRAALFVGAVVGAGFATGQEIRLFFAEDGVANLVIASLFMAICAYAFLELGALRIRWNPSVLLVTDTAITLSSLAVYAAMIAAAEGVLYELTGVSNLSILLAVGLLFVSSERIGWISSLNLIAVPLMTAIIVVVGLRGGSGSGGAVHLLRSFAYGGMNLLFSGALMMKEGERITRKERLIASLIAGAVIFLLLLFMYRSVGGRGEGEMPFLLAARDADMGKLASVALLLAILTTMASCAYLVTDRLTLLFGDRSLVAPAVVLLGILVAQWGFQDIVRTTYPVVSYLGLAASALALLLWGISLFRYEKVDKPFDS